MLDRVREQLAAVQHHGSVPPFTVSFGVAARRGDLRFSEVIELADEALMRAKAGGRDRVVVAGEAPADGAALGSDGTPAGSVADAERGSVAAGAIGSSVGGGAMSGSAGDGATSGSAASHDAEPGRLDDDRTDVTPLDAGRP